MTVRKTNGGDVKVGLKVLEDFCGVLDDLAKEPKHAYQEVASTMSFVENLTQEQRVGVTAVYEFSRRISSLLR